MTAYEKWERGGGDGLWTRWNVVVFNFVIPYKFAMLGDRASLDVLLAVFRISFVFQQPRPMSYLLTELSTSPSCLCLRGIIC